jgi:hypothetical protein
VVGAQGLHRTRRPERRARGWQLSLGDEICARKMFWSTGTYKEVVANKKIVSTMSFSNENGKTIPGSQVSVPGQWPNEITVIVEFSESEGKARVTVTEVGIPLIVYALMRRLVGLSSLTRFNCCSEERSNECNSWLNGNLPSRNSRASIFFYLARYRLPQLSFFSKAGATNLSLWGCFPPPPRLGWEGGNRWRKRQWCPAFQRKESWGSLS